MDSSYDVIVVGAGAAGSATAYHSAKAGHRTLLLEQFEIDHGRGSSHGASRIIRYAYDHPIYIQMAKAAYPAWSELEEEAGETLVVHTGGVDFSRRGEPMFEGMLRSLVETGIPHEIFSPEEARHRFPQFRLDDDMLMLYQDDAGALKASRCVLAHVRLARRHGAVVLDNTPVLKISAAGDVVTVETTQGIFQAAKLILAAGAWTRRLVNLLDMDLPLTPVKCQENYFEADTSADYEPGRFPVFIAHFPEAYGYMPYGLPSLDGSGVKVALHGGPSFDPEQPERQTDQHVIEMVKAFMQKHIPGATGRLISSRVCLYTMTPDEHFVIDLHPEHANVVIASCCSGHGFKFSPVLGKILADLALTGQTEHDISLFRASRFALQSK
jgi:sarcosine oxidase